MFWVVKHPHTPVALHLANPNVCTVLARRGKKSASSSTSPVPADEPTNIRTERVVSRTRKIWPSDITKLVEEFNKGSSQRQLAIQFGIHRETVGKLLREAGVNTSRHRIPEAKAREICRLYATGLSCISVGRQLGMHPSSIYSLLKRRGVKLRDARWRTTKSRKKLS